MTDSTDSFVSRLRGRWVQIAVVAVVLVFGLYYPIGMLIAHKVDDNLEYQSPAAEVPAANGVTDARSLSRLYAALIGAVEADERFPAADRILAPETVAAATTCQTSGSDKSLFFETTFGLGFMTASPFSPYGGPKGFGHAGAGGSVGFADPDQGLACGYVMSKMSMNLSGDPRSQGRHLRDEAGY